MSANRHYLEALAVVDDPPPRMWECRAQAALGQFLPPNPFPDGPLPGNSMEASKRTRNAVREC